MTAAGAADLEQAVSDDEGFDLDTLRRVAGLTEPEIARVFRRDGAAARRRRRAGRPRGAGSQPLGRRADRRGRRGSRAGARAGGHRLAKIAALCSEPARRDRSPVVTIGRAVALSFAAGAGAACDAAKALSGNAAGRALERRRACSDRF